MSTHDLLVYSEISQLHKTIAAQIEATNKQSRVMVYLTVAAIVLAVVQVIGAGVQVWVALR